MYRPDKTTKQEVRNSMKHQTPNSGNWIPKTMLQVLWGITGLTLATALAAVLIWKSRIISIFAFLLFLLMGGMTVYMQLCRRAFSFEGGGVMGQIHQYLLSKLSWNGKGRLLDIGCGSGVQRHGLMPRSRELIIGAGNGITPGNNAKRTPGWSRPDPSAFCRAMPPGFHLKRGTLMLLSATLFSMR